MASRLKTIGLGIGAAAVAGLALVPIAIRVSSLAADEAVAVAQQPVKQAAKAPPPAAAPRPADTGFVVKRVLDVPSPMKIGAYAWDDAGVPDGPLLITVDLEAGVLSAFRDGYEIGTAAILYGADEKPTPQGIFPILMKDAHHFSRQYNNAPMPYTMRLTSDGVSIHGSSMQYGGATHGCIGVPVPFAAKLFALAKIGDQVVITSGRRLDLGGQIAG